MALPGPITGTLYFAGGVFIVLVRLAIKRYKLLPTVLYLCLGMQICTVVGVPLFVLVMRCCSTALPDEEPKRGPLQLGWLPRLTTVSGYAGLWVCMYLASSELTELQVWQCSAAVESLAFAIILLRLTIGQTAAGISAKMLLLDAVRLSCKLVASFWLGRRLPRKSSDSFVHTCDAMSLTVACLALLCVRVPMRASYQIEADVFGIVPWIVGALVLAGVVHVEIGQQFLPDCLWTFALYVDGFALLPQLQLVAQNGGVIDEAMSHHTAAIFGSRCLALAFWWLIRNTWLRGTTLTGWCILLGGLLQLVVLSHYMCYYFRGCFTRGICSGVPLVCAEH